MDPEQQPFISEPTPSPTNSPSPKNNRKVIALVVALIVIIVLAVVAILLVNHKTSQRSATPQESNNPGHLSGVAVGSYAYVNACDVFSPQQQAALFAPASGDALVQEQYAENGLPVSAIPSTGIESNCSRDFETGTLYDGTTLTFAIDQYPTTAAAKADYAAYSQTQAQLDKGNNRFGTDLTTDFLPLGSVANTVYSASKNMSYTLDGNKVLSFSAILANVSNDTFSQALQKAIPAMVSSVASQKPGNPTVSDPSFGKMVGSSTIKNPCSFYTAADFAKAYGGMSDPSVVTATYTHQANEYLSDDTTQGEANNSCERTRYPGSSTAIADMMVTIEYYKSSTEAAQSIQQFAASQEASGNKSQTVSGVGNYAVLIDQADSSSPNNFYVQKGSYVLDLNGGVAGDAGLTNPTSAQYQRLATILTAKL